MAKQQKTAIILARIEQKNAPQSFYKVRASEPLEIGEETKYPIYYHNGRRYNTYTVRLVNCKVRSCDCPASGNCYHKDQCQVLEDARFADRRATLFARYAAFHAAVAAVNEINAKYAKAVPTNVTPITSRADRGTLGMSAERQAAFFMNLPSRQKVQVS